MNSTAWAIQCPPFGTAQTALGTPGDPADSMAHLACPTDREPFFQLLGRQMRTVFLPPPPLSNASVIAIRHHFSPHRMRVWRGRAWTGRVDFTRPHAAREDHAHIAALCSCRYNFARTNGTVRMSPAMACGLEQRLWDVGNIVKLAEEWEAQAA